MVPDLHLLVELDCWLPSKGQTGALLRLETYLGTHGDITLTLAGPASLTTCLERMASFGDRLAPDRFITEGGLAIFHARDDGSWAEDVEYRRWVGTQWDPLALQRVVATRPSCRFRQILGDGSGRRALFKAEPDLTLPEAVAGLEACLDLMPFPGRVAVQGDVLEVVPGTIGYHTAAAHLRRRQPEACCQVACGCTEAFLEVFQGADCPVLLAGGSLAFSTPGLPLDKIYFSLERGADGILEALRKFHAEQKAR